MAGAGVDGEVGVVMVIVAGVMRVEKGDVVVIVVAVVCTCQGIVVHGLTQYWVIMIVVSHDYIVVDCDKRELSQ